MNLFGVKCRVHIPYCIDVYNLIVFDLPVSIVYPPKCFLEAEILNGFITNTKNLNL